MKKGFVVLLAVVFCCILLTGCYTSYINQPSSELKVRTEANVKPVISVGGQIEGMAAVTRVCFIFLSGPGKFAEGINYGNNDYRDESISASIFGNTVTMAKAAAAYRACAENKADFIICPRYVITVTDYVLYKVVQAKVTGYKGVLLDVTLPENENKGNENNMMIQESLKSISTDLQGLKDEAGDMIKTQRVNKDDVKASITDDIQKDIIKNNNTSGSPLKLDSNLKFTD